MTVKIAVDITAFRDKPSGIGLYIFNLVQELHQCDNVDLTLFYQPSFKNWLKGDLSKNIPLSNLSTYTIPFPVTLTNLFPILYNIPTDKFDIIHGTDHYVYPFKNTKTVMTIHDLTFIKYPQYSNKIIRSYTGRIKRCLPWTDAVITCTESTKKDVVKHLNISRDKVYVVPLASRYKLEDYLPQDICSDYDFNAPYILFVGTLEPRKNITTLIKAFNYLKNTYKVQHELVIIGQKGWLYQPILNAISASPYQTSIHHLDYLNDHMVATFYQKADVFVYPSNYEGFGLPVLEAMTLGAPVITSNISSLPEVAGDAAILINPHSYQDIGDAIYKVVSCSTLRLQLIGKGKQRAGLYSWQETAIKTLQVYQKLLK